MVFGAVSLSISTVEDKDDLKEVAISKATPIPHISVKALLNL